MLSQDQVDFVEHLLATAGELPARFPLISAGEFIRRMGATMALPPPTREVIAAAEPPVPLQFNKKQSASQRRRWAEQNAASERALSELLANRPRTMQDLSFDLRWSLSRVSKFLKRVGAVGREGIWSLPSEPQRLAS